MSEKEFAEIALTVCLTGLIGYMLFIVWKLVKDSKAGKFGGAIMFLVLCFGIFGFVMKSLIKYFLDI